jgi:hypothetical protein
VSDGKIYEIGSSEGNMSMQMTLRERLREIAQRRISHEFADMAFVPEQLNRLAILFFIDQIPECEDTKIVRDALKNFRVQGWIE